MGTMNLPLDIYDTLERRLGRDDAMVVAKIHRGVVIPHQRA